MVWLPEYEADINHLWGWSFYLRNEFSIAPYNESAWGSLESTRYINLWSRTQSTNSEIKQNSVMKFQGVQGVTSESKVKVYIFMFLKRLSSCAVCSASSDHCLRLIARLYPNTHPCFALRTPHINRLRVEKKLDALQVTSSYEKHPSSGKYSNKNMHLLLLWHQKIKLWT